MVTSKAIFPALAVVLTIASTSSAISIAQARAPAAASNTTSTTTPASTGDAAPVYIACVVDTALASLTTSETVQASSRAECSTGCASSTTNNWDLAFFRQDTSECRCALAADAPGSDDVVYAVDEAGNCRTQDDASVEYLTLASPYTLSTCYIPPLSAPTNGSSSTAPTAIGCFDFCYHSSSTVTGAITVRPAYDDDKDIFEYECGCYASLDAVGGHQKMDCGFGIASIYVAA
ncbi:hypothetical protein I316_05408 [Kwoniella heveanensis BCC8398]|uniref:Uncharacterized protein n=1 Tax=Kwoniella heveanensis BCC8398 TaxID=1296120 RepID=A0A1B9GP41_9TREE|nr:hypothetical protein I316_05408 [Kwoniella heveanensis BCC8398]